MLHAVAFCNSVFILHSLLRLQRMPIQIQRDILVIGQVEEGGEEGAGGGVVVVGGVLVCARCRREIKVLVELDGDVFEVVVLVGEILKFLDACVIIMVFCAAAALCHLKGDFGSQHGLVAHSLDCVVLNHNVRQQGVDRQRIGVRRLIVACNIRCRIVRHRKGLGRCKPNHTLVSAGYCTGSRCGNVHTVSTRHLIGCACDLPHLSFINSRLLQHER